MEAFLQRELFAGERLLWSGKSASGLVLRPIEFFLIPFSLLWAGFAVFWNVSVWATPAGWDFKLFGVPFLVMGVYITVGRFLHDAWLRRRLLYAVTDRRVLVIRRGALSNVRSLDLQRLPAISLTEARDGTGSIRFGGSDWSFARMNFGLWVPALSPNPQFLRIADARRVYNLVQAQAAPRSAA